MKTKVLIWVLLLSVFMLFSGLTALAAEQASAPMIENVPLQINAKSALLMCANTGQFIFEMDAHTKRPIASVTKIMTMLLVMEALDQKKITMDEVVTASEHACSMGGTQVYLAVGEEFTVHELL